MKGKWALTIFLSALLIVLLFVGIHVYLGGNGAAETVDIYVGVDVAYDNITDLKALVDEVKSYTNFFVVGSTGITFNETRLNDVCQYLHGSGLSFATYTHTTTNATPPIEFNQLQWISYARQRWNGTFLGLYTYDEPGGHQIDHDDPFMVVPQADNNSDAANKYVETLTNKYLADYIPLNFSLITSDYALYEFDYRAGYDIVMAEYAWNHSRPINTALCRGSATMQGKNWGAMLTYTYDIPPYLASGPELYDDMVTAYQNGAKYILVFDYAMKNSTKMAHGILQQEHLDAIKQFWEYVKTHPRPSNPVNERVAYVLPPYYGYGFRGPNDSLWGLWGADNLSSQIWNDVNMYAQQYKQKFDIIYTDTPNFNAWNYSKLIFWNGTTLTKT
jgi:hypothetical protein